MEVDEGGGGAEDEVGGGVLADTMEEVEEAGEGAGGDEGGEGGQAEKNDEYARPALVAVMMHRNGCKLLLRLLAPEHIG